MVERSKDFGQTWKVFRYYAEDCAAHFPWVPAGASDSVDDVVCDGRYSGSQPSTDGEVLNVVHAHASGHYSGAKKTYGIDVRFCILLGLCRWC